MDGMEPALSALKLNENQIKSYIKQSNAGFLPKALVSRSFRLKIKSILLGLLCFLTEKTLWATLFQR